MQNKTNPLFLKAVQAMKLPLPEAEYRFCHDRRWRFDYAFLEAKVAVEQEGGVWTYGAHVRPKHFLADMEKYNKATVMGWRVLRYTPDQMLNEALEDLKEIFKKD